MPKIDRRDFLKLVGVGAGAAATAGCSDPAAKLIPYVIQPEEIIPGIPVVYASTCQECPAGCGLHVKTREGRPIKLEGNPLHPVNRGTLCARGQVGLGWTYHPDRYDGPRSATDGPISWDQATAMLASWIQAVGRGEIAILGGDPGATAGAQLDRFVELVEGQRVVYDPLAEEARVAASKKLFGLPSRPLFDLSNTDLIISLGSDFLEEGEHQLELSRQLVEARDINTESKQGARFVYFGARLSLTAGNADEWIPAKPGSEGILALALARTAWDAGARPPADADRVGALLAGVNVDDASTRSGVPKGMIVRIGKALAKSRASVVIPPGKGLSSRRAVATAASVFLLDYLVGAVGSHVRLLPPAAAHPNRREGYKAMRKLTAAVAEGKVKLLLVNDANPIYAYPGFTEALTKAKQAGHFPKLVSFASVKDETAESADLILPTNAPLEAWGDRVPRPGIRSLQQPTFRPLKDTRHLVDALWAAARQAGIQGAPTGDFRAILQATWADAGNFTDLLKAGGSFQEDASSLPASLAGELSWLGTEPPLIEGDGDYLLMPIPSPLLRDGRGANLPWLQEIADPVTKLTWRNWVEVSKATARKLGVTLGDIVSVKTPAGSAELPIFVRGGIMDDVIAIPTGQGHTVGTWASENGKLRGANVSALIPPESTDEEGGRAWLTVKASLSPTGTARPLAAIIHSDNARGRDLCEAIELADLSSGGAAHATTGADGSGHGEGALIPAQHLIEKTYDPIFDSDEVSPYRWGMVIDLDRCTGCSACVAACYTENNIPLVGERQTLMNRNMDWIRIERWIGGGDTQGPNTQFDRNQEKRWGSEELGNNDVRHSPMTCQQCGAAPCEAVCPVIATYHNPEGLNVMVYNRCVGTRYCSNNCPYKVRRFNFWDYSQDNWPGDLGLMLNPDVTVRGRGVMEKCTFCTQRVIAARQTAKDENRVIADGEVVTACQQTCPTQAISFGNLKDGQSAVVKKSTQPARNYHVLQELNTRPAITYLAKVIRGQVKG